MLAGTACSSSTAPHFRPCTAADAAVTLAVNQYVAIDPGADSGCVVFPATTTLPAEYLLVPQLASGVPGQVAGFRLGGDTILPAPSAPAPDQSAELNDAERFHTYLRLGDERRSWGFAPESATGARPKMAATGSPPGMNTQRVFEVCAKTDCSQFDRVVARVRAVSAKVVIFVDTLAPAGGLDSTALDSIARLFDQRLYAIDTAAFGRESDIDSNTVVLVLMTNTVNKLVTASACNAAGGAFIAGFFFGADLDPAFRTDPRSNKGEVFYSIVADPTGKLSCSHSTADVEKFVPVTFIHEFQHMISFNQHVLVRGGTGEVLWLNEGFSHYAEELGGRSYAVTPDAQVTMCLTGSIECRFYAGDLLDAYDYLDSTSTHFLLPTAGIGTLAERGAAWLFVRYVVDKYSVGSTMASWDTLTRSLVGTSQTGAQNITTVTGAPFATVVGRWALANYITDRGGAPPELQYDSWNLHSVYAALHNANVFRKPYPLVPDSAAGRDAVFTGTLRAGSGIYFLATQPAGDPGFAISFTASNGSKITPAFLPRLNVMRLQ
ncbi:MAG: hypothetical protein DMD59_00415 [Gemmatimonadetes bacterium]|nr:MAG: hypothetical protein DMD59_00415 [Gemmatimonadota bacterium]